MPILFVVVMECKYDRMVFPRSIHIDVNVDMAIEPKRKSSSSVKYRNKYFTFDISRFYVLRVFC